MALKLTGYRLEAPLYQSVSTIVARGTRLSDGAPVMVKYPAAEKPAPFDVARWRNEHEILQLLDGAGSIRGLALEHAGHRPVLVTENLGATTLAARFAGARPAIAEFLRLALGLARAVAAVHARDIIHKDLHPQNVVV